ncbi:MAG TPA: helix-turn-helix transcriptional regulator [Streptosporangiaceae bacterium]|nr:helix-turn-helix transcriptional regulator [Streptosporangiaceae bacterium]
MPEASTTSHFAHGLRACRKAAGLNQVALAKKAGCRQSTISQLENRRRRGTVGTLTVIAQALGCTIDDLL